MDVIVAGVSSVPLTGTIDLGVKRTTAFEAKFVPLRVNVKGAQGARPHCVGEMEFNVGAGPVMVKASAFVVLGIWLESKTFTCTRELAPRFAAGTTTVNSVVVAVVGVRWVPPNCTTEFELKPSPMSVIVRSLAPTGAVVGEIERR